MDSVKIKQTGIVVETNEIYLWNKRESFGVTGNPKPINIFDIAIKEFNQKFLDEFESRDYLCNRKNGLIVITTNKISDYEKEMDLYSMWLCS